MIRSPTIFRFLFGAAALVAPSSVVILAQVQEESTSPRSFENDPITDDEFRLPIDPTAAASAERLIPKLGSPAYKEREAATDGLIEIGAPALAKLRAAYHTTDNLEVRLRIERIVRTAYLNHHVYDRSGFLGIKLQPYSANTEDHPRLPKGAVGVMVDEVIRGTAAERAGLGKDDVIYEIDGEPVRGEGMQVIETFSATIRNRGPGGKMTLSVLRGVQRLSIGVTIGRCPEEIARQGTVKTVSENHYKAVARFPRWWEEYFLQSEKSPLGASQARDSAKPNPNGP